MILTYLYLWSGRNRGRWRRALRRWRRAIFRR